MFTKTVRSAVHQPIGNTDLSALLAVNSISVSKCFLRFLIADCFINHKSEFGKFATLYGKKLMHSLTPIGQCHDGPMYYWPTPVITVYAGSLYVAAVKTEQAERRQAEEKYAFQLEQYKEQVIWFVDSSCALPSGRQHLSSNDCLKDKREDCHSCSVLCCVVPLCIIITGVALSYKHQGQGRRQQGQGHAPPATK